MTAQRAAVRAASAAAIALLLAGIAPAAATQVWFGPLQPRPDVAARLRADPGNSAEFLGQLDAAQQDWDALFEPATLDAVAPLMQVYGIGTGFVLGMPDAELKDRLDKLTARHVKLAFGAQPVISSDPNCGHTEGYDDVRNLVAEIAKLKRLHIEVQILAMDGGLWYGHYATGEQECHLSLEQTIAQVALTVETFAAAFPGIVIGDIEPTVPLTREPGWQEAFKAYKQGLEAASGAKISILQLDIAWNNGGWKQAVTEETALARSLGMQIGYIYDGDGEDRSDAAWLGHARRNIAEMEGGLGLVPDQAIIASWNLHPTHSVGPALGGTLASLLAYYAEPATRIAIAEHGRTIAGRLTDGIDHPRAATQVSLFEAGVNRSSSGLPETKIQGVVPANAHTALLGVRINAECLCAGKNDLLFGGLRYDESGSDGRHARETFLPELRHFAQFGGNGVATIRLMPDRTDDAVHVTTTAAQNLNLTGRPFAVTPGRDFQLSASVLNHLDSDVFGTATIIWLDGEGHGIKRDNIVIPPSLSLVASATTDARGRFSFSRPTGRSGAPAGLSVKVNDASTFRGAIATVPQ